MKTVQFLEWESWSLCDGILTVSRQNPDDNLYIYDRCRTSRDRFFLFSALSAFYPPSGLPADKTGLGPETGKHCLFSITQQKGQIHRWIENYSRDIDLGLADILRII